jgi:hypothetical protein
MSSKGVVLVTVRYAARSSRIRRREACGGSPATDRIIRSKWNREKCSRLAPLLARLVVVERLGEVGDEPGEGVGGVRHSAIIAGPVAARLDHGCPAARRYCSVPRPVR